ncbi:unnamed protein product, partial [Ectocarpus fasciculatus]
RPAFGPSRLWRNRATKSSLGMMTPAPDPWPTSGGSGSCCTSGRDDSSLEPRVSAAAKRTSTICYRRV